ncbi:synaptotagmin-like protein 2 isoform 2-T2 [Discoglossus pictus]
MIDLSFLTEAEQEAILKVLSRDAELKKSEEERVRHLQDVVDDENELKYKTGQWFYEAKSKRHRDKIHGADLVRASIRKRKQPSTIAELSKGSLDPSKKSWVNNVKGLFIPPELYGVMEEPEEDLEALQQTKAQANQSAKRVSFLTTDNKENLVNGTASPAKIRKNPFNADLEEIGTDRSQVKENQPPENGTGPNADILPSYIKFGVKLPFPDRKEATQVLRVVKSQSQVPTPKPRTVQLKKNEQSPNDSSNNKTKSLVNGTSVPKGILKRWSSSSSTDSETLWTTQGVDSNKIVLPGSPILEGPALSEEDVEELSGNSQEQLKQVRFSENVQERQLSPCPGTPSGREIGEFRILDTMLYKNDWDKPGVYDHSASEDPMQIKNLSTSLDFDTEEQDFDLNSSQEGQRFSPTSQTISRAISTERKNKNKIESSLDDSKPVMTFPSQNTNSEPEPLYAVVKKIPKQDLPEDFDMEDVHMESRVFGQELKKRNIVKSGQPLEFGKSYSGGGKITYDTSSLDHKPQRRNIVSTERPYTGSNGTGQVSGYDYGDNTLSGMEHEDSYIDPVHSVLVHQVSEDLHSKSTRNQPYVFDKNESWTQPSTELFKEPKNYTGAPQKFNRISLDSSEGLTFLEDQVGSLEYLQRGPKMESTYKSITAKDIQGADEYKPSGLTTNLSSPKLEKPDVVSDTRESLNAVFLSQLKSKNDLPQSVNFKVMSLKDRINESPTEKNLNPSQFQNLKSYWNLDEKNKPRDPEVSPNKILSGILNRSRSINSETPQRNSADITIEAPKVTEVSTSKVLTDFLSRTRPMKSGLQQRSSIDPSKDPEISTNQILSNSYEEDQTSQKVASWLAQTPTNYYEEQMYPSEEHFYPKDEVKENVKKFVAPDKSNVDEFYSALEKLREEASTGDNTEMENQEPTEDIMTLPKPQVGVYTSTRMRSSDNLSEEDQTSQKVATWLAHSPSNFDEEETHPREEHIYPSEEIVENVQKSLAPQRSNDDEFSRALEKLKEEASLTPKITEMEKVDNYEKMKTFPKEETAFNNINSVKVTTTEAISPTTLNPIVKKPGASEVKSSDRSFFQRVMEISQNSSVNEPVKTFTPSEQQIEGKRDRLHSRTDGNLELKYAQEEEVIQNILAPANTANDAFKIGMEKLVKEHESIGKEDNELYENSLKEQPNKYQVQKSKAPKNVMQEEEIIEKTTLPTKNDLDDFTSALKKLEIEASKPSPILESRIPDSKESSDIEDNLSNEDQADLNAQPNRVPSPSEEETETPNNSLYMDMKMLPDLKYSFNVKETYPVEEETIENTVAKTRQNNDEFQRRLNQLEEKGNKAQNTEDVNLSNSDSEEKVKGDKIKVSQIPYRDVLISKTVYSNIESKPSIEDETYKAEDKNEQKDIASPTERRPEDLYRASRLKSTPINAGYGLSGSYTRNPRNVLYKKPEIEVSKPISVDPKQGLEDPVLSALARSAAKAVLKDQLKPDIPKEDIVLSDKEENSLQENAEKLKRLSQSVPAFLDNETDGRDTDSASESSFQIGRHKKSPSSLTNLSGSSGMASLSSVSGSVMSVYSGDFGNVDIKGNIQFAVDYVEQSREFNVFVCQCKDLAVADLKRQRSDPYVKSYLLPDKAKMGKRKSAVKKKTLNPTYNEVLRYKIDKPTLLNQTLNLSVWHNDPLGRNSFLGEVDLVLATWDWDNKEMNWYPLQPRTPSSGIGLENRGETKLALKYIPEMSPGIKLPITGEVHIWIKECNQLPILRGNKINSFIKCTILPDTSRKSRQKTRTVDRTPNPVFNHTMVYDGFKEEDLREACVELTVWDHNRLTNHFLGGLRIGLGTGKSYGTAVDWMDSNIEESTMWEKMINTPNTWIEGVLPLRMLRMAKLIK